MNKLLTRPRMPDSDVEYSLLNRQSPKCYKSVGVGPGRQAVLLGAYHPAGKKEKIIGKAVQL